MLNIVKFKNKKYIKYKRKQVSLKLNKGIALTLKRYINQHNRNMFEYQLKSYFLKKSFNTIDENINSTIKNLSLFISDF